jgi:hypothetical protein
VRPIKADPIMTKNSDARKGADRPEERDSATMRIFWKKIQFWKRFQIVGTQSK